MGQAVGIPNTTDYGNLQGLKPGNVYTISVQRHKAERAGEHLDFRIGDPKVQLLSWALPKAKLPEPNERLLAVQQPLHEYEYATFEGTIDEGYGKGEVKLEKLGKALVTDIEPGKIHITIISDRYPTRYVLVQPQNYKQNDWLILNTTPNKPIDYEKIHMRQLKPDELNDYLDKNKEQPLYASPKIDGAHVIILIKDGKLEVFSYRISKVHGGNILHTERLFRIRPKVQIPERLNGTILKGELYAVDKDTGEAIPVNVLSGLLNSSIYRTYQDAANKGVQFRIGLFDIYKYGDQIIDPEAVDYPSRLNLIREFLPQLDKKIFHVIEPARKPEEVLALWDIITQGRHPLTKEGIVLYPHKGNPVKVKAFQERDVYIREILPGEGKYKGKAAGGFTYSLEPNGPIVGHVGTGFSDELRREMWEDPDEFINRRARVKYQE
ncbi:MAG: DNA polymerase ligase N-terminal domain-containing protein, partial [Candidatus Kryptoniota bacterium]